MNGRRGVSLVELMVVMSGCTIVLSMSAMLIHRSMRAQSETRQFFSLERAALRLAQQFRADVHVAREATVDAAELDDGVVAKVTFVDESAAEYREDAGSRGAILRILVRDGEVVSRERFSLAARIKVAARRRDAPDRLALEITGDALAPTDRATATAVRQAPVHLQVEAVVGRRLPRASNSGNGEAEFGER